MTDKIKLSQANLMLLRANHYKETIGKPPVILRNPFSGEVIFVQKTPKELTAV